MSIHDHEANFAEWADSQKSVGAPFPVAQGDDKTAEAEEFVRRMLLLAQSLKEKIHRLNTGSKRKPNKQVNVLYAQRNILQVTLAIFDKTVARIEPIKARLKQYDAFDEKCARGELDAIIAATEADYRAGDILSELAVSPGTAANKTEAVVPYESDLT